MIITHQLIEYFPVAAFVVRKDNLTIAFFNKKALGLTGLSEPSLTSSNMSAFVHPDYIHVGNYEGCVFTASDQSIARGKLVVQAVDDAHLLVSFIPASPALAVDTTGSLESGNHCFNEALKMLIGSSTDSIFIMQNGIIQYVNPRLLSVSGYTSDELCGKHFSEFVAPGELDKINMFFENRAKGEQAPYVYDSVALLKNGTQADVEVHFEYITYNYEPAQQVILRDITDRKQIEKKYRHIVDFAPVGFYQTTREGEILLTNNEFAHILGFKHTSQLISRNISEFYFAAGEREKLIQKYDNAPLAEVKNLEVKFRNANGSPIWVLMTARAIKDDKGNTLNYDGFIVDITSRKKNENVQKLLFNLSKASYATISLKDYLVQIQQELKQIMKADNFYVALYDKITEKYTFPVHIDEYEDYSSDAPAYLHNTLTNYVRKTAKGMLVTPEIESALHENHQIEVVGEPSPIWLGVPLMDTTTRKAIGVVALQDYHDEKAYTADDLQTLEIIAGHIGSFIERVKMLDHLNTAKIEAESGVKMYKSLFNDNKSVMMLIDPLTAKIMDANKSACQFYGYTHQQLKALKITDINTLPDDAVKREMKNALTEKRQHFYFRHRLANGEIRDVEVYSGKVNISGNKLLYSIVHDISDRRKAEEQVLRLSTSVEQSPVITLITDTAGKIQYVNKAFTKVTGYTFEEVKGKNPRFLQSGKTKDEVHARMWETILSGQTWQGEMINRRKNGEHYVEMNTITAVKDESGTIINLLAIKEDISERKRHEQEISRLYQAIGQAPSPVALTDLDGFFIYVNPTFCELSGYSKEELIGTHTRILNSGYQSNAFYRDLWETIIAGNTWTGEIVNRKKNGELFLESAKISPVINPEGEPTHYIKVASDITQERETQNELIRAKEKAEESDRLKTAFLANMSHEIRTPMNGIMGFTQLLAQPGLQNETRKEYISIIRRSGERMLNTVNDIIEISKIEAGIVQVKLAPVDVIEIAQQLVRFFQPEASKKDLALCIDNESDEKIPVVLADQAKFESIFTNLLKNAIKYTDKGTITVSWRTNKGFIQFSVKDTGIGIPEHRLEAIFNRFEQADIADTRVFEGSGLGLAIVKSYLEMMGGRIWVESVEREGSQFYFTIPLKAVQETKSAAPVAARTGTSANLKNTNILLVEDDEVSSIYMKIILQDVVRKVILVHSGEEAIEACKTMTDIDIILMDIKMPGIDGFETTRRIRQFNKDIIIIAQTAFALVGDREKAISAGCNEYISKPVAKNELIKKFESVLKS